jgi:hypothetical protein
MSRSKIIHLMRKRSGTLTLPRLTAWLSRPLLPRPLQSPTWSTQLLRPLHQAILVRCVDIGVLSYQCSGCIFVAGMSALRDKSVR